MVMMYVAVDSDGFDGGSYNGRQTPSCPDVVGRGRSVRRVLAAVPRRQPVPQLRQRQRYGLADSAVRRPATRPFTERAEPDRLLHHEQHVQTCHDVSASLSSPVPQPQHASTHPGSSLLSTGGPQEPYSC